jgi:hypothetical protein
MSYDQKTFRADRRSSALFFYVREEKPVACAEEALTRAHSSSGGGGRDEQSYRRSFGKGGPAASELLRERWDERWEERARPAREGERVGCSERQHRVRRSDRCGGWVPSFGPEGGAARRPSLPPRMPRTSHQIWSRPRCWLQFKCTNLNFSGASNLKQSTLFIAVYMRMAWALSRGDDCIANLYKTDQN